jgi:methionyl aminopeptidase
MDDWIKAGEIASEVRKYGKKLIKPGASILEVTNKVENKISELGGKPAFPAQFSINNIAAHYTAIIGDKTKFNDGDLVKFDHGVQINGAIADTAVSKNLGDHSKIIKASENALNAAIESLKPGITNGEIGGIIEETILSSGFNPITNLSGHGIARYVVHTSPSMVNYDSGERVKLKKGQIIAIEPFVSTGEGLITEGTGSQIYSLSEPKVIRNKQAREILSYIKEEYKTLPFAKRNLLAKFSKFQIAVGVSNLLRENVIMEYRVLPEKDPKSFVAQTEHTIIVGEKVTTE